MDLNVSYALGCDVNCQVTDGFKAAYDIAKRAKAVIAVMGLDQGIERYSISPLSLLPHPPLLLGRLMIEMIYTCLVYKTSLY